MQRDHKFDPYSEYCIHCGVARQDADDQSYLCTEEGSNVTGISHIVRGARLRAMAKLDRRTGD